MGGEAQKIPRGAGHSVRPGVVRAERRKEAEKRGGFVLRVNPAALAEVELTRQALPLPWTDPPNPGNSRLAKLWQPTSEAD